MQAIWRFSQKSRLNSKLIALCVAAFAAIFNPPNQSAYGATGALLKVRLPLAPTGSTPDQDIHFVVIGQLKGERLWVNESWHDLQTGRAIPQAEPPVVRPPPPLLGADGQPLPVAIDPAEVMPAQFEMPGDKDAPCEQSTRFRELSFLANSLTESVQFIEVAGGYKTKDCRTRLTEALAGSGLPVKNSEATSIFGQQPKPADVITVRVFFKKGVVPPTPVTPVATAGSKAQPSPAATTESPATSATPATPDKPDGPSAAFVLVDGRPVTLNADGWFAADVGSMRQVVVDVRNASMIRLQVVANLLLLKNGLSTGYRNERYQGIDFSPAGDYQIELVTGDDIDKLLGIELSVPLFLKLGVGYTKLAPLPTEREQDRPTLVASVRTYPFWGKYHFASDFVASLRSESRIPWTVLATGYVGTDLMRIRNQIAIPVGFGLRMFNSKIKQKAADEDDGKTIVIPESVLGPAAQIGISYKAGLLYMEASGSMTPLFVPGAKTIVTFNPSLSFGYQMSELDTLVINVLSHDLRYPTSDGEAKVIASTALIGYQRDLY